MQISNDDQILRPNDPAWHFLAEYSLSGFVLDAYGDDEMTPKFLSHLIQDLGIPPESLIKIERTLAGFAKEAIVRSNQGNIALPLHLYLYCQKKIIEDARSTTASNFYSITSATESTPIHQHSELKMNGGWGYFLIERGRGSTAEPHHWIDLYLYQEGA